MSNLENKCKKFHFQEIDWIIYFPRFGNEKRKYYDYRVAFRDRKKGVPQLGKRINLGEVLDNPEFEKTYPHTVGFYKVSSGKGTSFRPAYLEIRRIQNVEEFWKFLNDLDM